MNDLTPSAPPVLPRASWLPTATAPIIRFELTETLGAGGEAAAKHVRWDAASQDYIVTSHLVTVADCLGIFAGQAGDRGYARWWPDRRAYEVFLMECPT